MTMLQSAKSFNTFRTNLVCPMAYAIRFKSTARENCEENPFPKCTPEKLQKTECIHRSKAKPWVFKHLIYNPECCIEECPPDTMPRFDDLYYKPSDKQKRKYTKTWRDCPSPRIKKKWVCNFEKQLPPIKRRNFKKAATEEAKCGSTQACEPRDIGLMVCKRKPKGKCPKIQLPGCKPSREPPTCTAGARGPSNCKKICTPYPAFSECEKPKTKKMRPIECGCLQRLSLCALYDYIKKGYSRREVPKAEGVKCD